MNSDFKSGLNPDFGFEIRILDFKSGFWISNPDFNPDPNPDLKLIFYNYSN
jgi:hypothetical protein